MTKHLYLVGVLILITTIACPNLGVAMSVDSELFLIDYSILQGRVIPAVSDFLDRGDPDAAKRLVNEAITSHQFQTSVRSAVNVDRMTAEYLANGSKELLEGMLPKEIMDDTGKVIQDQVAIRKRQTETILSPFLVLFVCSWSQDESQTRVALSHSELTDYLRSKSLWMKEMLESSNELLWNAPEMPLSLGGEAKLLTTEEASTLLTKLREVPPPLHGSELIKKYETLQKILQIAAQDPRFRVLIRTT